MPLANEVIEVRRNPLLTLPLFIPPFSIFPNLFGSLPLARNGFCFTDGCGRSCSNFQKALARELQILEPVSGARYRPSAFQVRFKGYKGAGGSADLFAVLEESVCRCVVLWMQGDVAICKKEVNRKEIAHLQLGMFCASYVVFYHNKAVSLSLIALQG